MQNAVNAINHNSLKTQKTVAQPKRTPSLWLIVHWKGRDQQNTKLKAGFR